MADEMATNINTGLRILKALGIKSEEHPIAKIEFTFIPNDVFKVKLTRLLRKSEVEKFAEIVEEFQLIKK
jgi:hypothetical protein